MKQTPKTEAEQQNFFLQFQRSSFDAIEKAGAVRLYYKLADTSICICFAGHALVPHLSPALEHLRVKPIPAPDLTLYVWDTGSTGVQPPRPPCEWSDFTDRGDIWGFNSKRIKTAFHWSEYSVNALDLQENIGLYWVKSTKGFPYWVYSSPFRTLFHWWMQKNGGQLLHAAAVATEKGAVLITGKGGSGKSSTAVNALHSGMLYLGDDYVVVKNDPAPVVYSLYCTAKLAPHDMAGFPELKELTNNNLASEPAKDTMFLFPQYAAQLRKIMPLKAIMAPGIVNREDTSLAPASFWNIHRAISFTTMSQLPGADLYTHEFISKLARALPCYELRLGSLRHKIPETLVNFINFDRPVKTTQARSEHSELPLISIIVPVYNGDKFIRKALQHILSQNYHAIEIIVVDDGSTDNTRQEIERSQIDLRYFYQNNRGPASARNLGVRNATGNYIAFLDVDDYWPENNLHLMMQDLQNNPDLDIVRGYAQLVKEDENGNVEFLGNPKASFPDYIGAGLYRKKVFSEVGLFDRTLRFGEDKDWYARAAELGARIKRLDEVTLFVRRHGGNMTEGKDLVELNQLKVFKKYLERKRSRIPSENEPDSEEA